MLYSSEVENMRNDTFTVTSLQAYEVLNQLKAFPISRHYQGYANLKQKMEEGVVNVIMHVNLRR